jgi:hypothetical protein
MYSLISGTKGRTIANDLESGGKKIMEIQSISAKTAFEYTASAQSTQDQQATATAKPAGGARGKPPAGGGTAKTSSSSDSSSSNKVYDKRDTDKDGTVSAAEMMQYAIKHPEESAESTSVDTDQNGYDQSGKLQANTSNLSSRIDISA